MEGGWLLVVGVALKRAFDRGYEFIRYAAFAG
jgi:hypothetical protein